MIDAGMLTEQQAIGHPDANKITRALGMKPEVEVEVRPEPMDLFAGDIVLLSSDGLTDLALAPDILGAVRQALASGNVEHACKQLVDMANNRGGHDNITVQMARVLEVPPKARATIPQAPPDASGAPSGHGMAGPPQRPQETFPMTAPEAQRVAPTPPAAPSPAGLQPSPGAAQQWAPVPPTATDIPPHARAAGPGPTMTEATPRCRSVERRGQLPGRPPPAGASPMPGSGRSVPAQPASPPTASTLPAPRPSRFRRPRSPRPPPPWARRKAPR